jgi:hypothetical protein
MKPGRNSQNLRGNKTVKELFTALALAQAEMEAATKDSNNPFFKSKYADLNSVMGAVKPALAKHGLAFIQVCRESDAHATIETVIIHSSGEQFACGPVSVPVNKNDAQGYGSALTYARRYSLASAFGVGAEDDDGNAAAKAKPVEQVPPKLVNPLIKTPDYDLTEARAFELYSAAKLAVEKFAEGNHTAAFEEVSGITDNGEKSYLWAVLKEYSAVRAMIKKAAAAAAA